jgi:GT2 family glycosyltransferase
MPSGSSESRSCQLAVVVLNWNGARDTLDCLRSLRKSHLPVHAIVVDNGSNDDSVREITDSGLADAVVETGDNLGYAEGNNVGLRLALQEKFPIVAVLNNDTVIEQESFKALLPYLADRERRALSPDIRYFDEPSRSWFAGGVLDNGWPRHLQSSELLGDVEPLRLSECLSGCCIVAESETWREVGLFDPDYFLTFEDSDWSLRARAQGVKLYVATRSLIRHKVSRSHVSAPVSLLSSFYFIRNGLMFETRYAKHHRARFVFEWLVRPSLQALRRRASWPDVAFRWLGAVAFMIRISGRAPRAVERLAGRLSSP